MDGLYKILAEHYDKIYDFKDYQDEAQAVKKLIGEYKTSDGDALLDVGCGTGKHLEYLNGFAREGVDLQEEMIAEARKRLPEATFYVQDMAQLDTGKQYDVITSMFSSIGYVPREDLEQTLTNIKDHLTPGGVAIIEPWITPAEADPMTTLHTYEKEDFKIVRVSKSRIEDQTTVIDMHYLVADDEITHYQETHYLQMYSEQQLRRAFSNAGLPVVHKADYGRGLYVARKD